jgi:menaquinone-9 beta-reductase
VVRYRTSGDGGGGGELRARLVVGADGRRSTVRNQAGIALSRDPEHHMIAGLLLDDVEVPDEHDFLAGQDELFMAAFHQGGGRLRVYLCYDIDDRHRYSGGEAVPRYLQDCAFGCLPFGDLLAKATPAGPLGAHPGFDTWCERPYGPGVVLVGDAAGFSNPVIGQGLSVALRDVRLVRDVIRGGDVSPTAFEPYAAERHERMRRLRHTARFMSTGFGLGVQATPATQAAARTACRARYFELQQTEPLVGALLASLFGGPEIAPPEAFDGRLTRAVAGA